MTVNIIFSETSAGDSMAETQEPDAPVTPGNESDAWDLFIRSDAVNADVTNCAWYITRFVSPNYLGDDADADLIEILGWGDGNDGFRINQVIPPSWTIGDDFDPADYDSFRNGHGDIDNQIPLSEDAIIGTSSGDGVLPIGEEAHVQVRFEIPASVPSGSGYRGVSLVFAYSATS